MRHDQTGIVDPLSAGDEEHVEIDRARPPRDLAGASKVGLDPLQGVEQRARLARPIDGDGGVEERGLLGTADRIGLVDARPRDDARMLADPAHRFTHRLDTGPEVGPEPDDDDQGVLPWSWSGFDSRPL